jgi:hypothetical protein
MIGLFFLRNISIADNTRMRRGLLLNATKANHCINSIVCDRDETWRAMVENELMGVERGHGRDVQYVEIERDSFVFFHGLNSAT